MRATSPSGSGGRRWIAEISLPLRGGWRDAPGGVLSSRPAPATRPPPGRAKGRGHPPRYAGRDKERAMARDVDYYERVARGLREAAERSRRESDPEQAMRHLTLAATQVLGDTDASKRPGSLKSGEASMTCSGIFFAAPRRDHLVLLAEPGYPPEQRRARIDINDSRPGYTVRTGEPVALPNTDEDHLFRQILSTARVGSTLYLPVVWGQEVIGMFNCAAQARYTYDETDIRLGLP